MAILWCQICQTSNKQTSNFAIGSHETSVSYSLSVRFLNSVLISAGEWLISCINERDFLSFFFSTLSFLISFFLTSSPLLDYKVGLCNQ